MEPVNAPLVSVIVPVYNGAGFIIETLESVRRQTHAGFECIIIDDGSTDNTAEVVQKWIAADRRYSYIYQPNLGLSAARNAGLDRVDGDLIQFLDADDVWLPYRLSESLKCFENRPDVGLAYGFNARIDPEGKVIDTFANRQSPSEGRIAPYIYTRRINLPCPTITFRKSCIDEVGLFDETFRATEDRDLWLRIALRYEVALAPKVIAHYRTSPGSMSTDPYRMLKAQLLFTKKHFGAPGCGILPRQIAWARAYKQLAEALVAQNKPWTALRSSMRAVALYPLDLDNARTAGSILLNWIGRRRSS